MLRDNEAWLRQCGEHMRENLRNGGYAAHVVEGVFEVRVRGVMAVQLG